MSFTYSQFVVNLANLLVVSTTDVGYTTVLPSIIDDAEQRLYRELNLLNTVVSDSSRALSAGNRNFSLPATNGTFYVVDVVNVVTPFGTTNPEQGVRNQLVESSRARLDFLFPSVTGSTVPQYFSFLTQTAIVVGPWPDQAYQIEVVGTIRPGVLSSSNVTTLLTAYFPDLFIAASMVFGAAYQQNFGAMTDNPQMSQSWETHLQALLRSAQTEETRKKLSTVGLRGNPNASPIAEK